MPLLMPEEPEFPENNPWLGEIVDLAIFASSLKLKRLALQKRYSNVPVLSISADYLGDNFYSFEREIDELLMVYQQNPLNFVAESILLLFLDYYNLLEQASKDVDFDSWVITIRVAAKLRKLINFTANTANLSIIEPAQKLLDKLKIRAEMTLVSLQLNELQEIRDIRYAVKLFAELSNESQAFLSLVMSYLIDEHQIDGVPASLAFGINQTYDLVENIRIYTQLETITESELLAVIRTYAERERGVECFSRFEHIATIAALLAYENYQDMSKYLEQEFEHFPIRLKGSL